MSQTAKDDIQFLKELQQQMKWEDENDYDCQASPRFWVIMDYKKEPAHEDYHDGDTSYFHNDGDHTEFETLEDLKEFLIEHEYDDEDEELRELLEDSLTDFDTLWDYVESNYEYFDTCFMREVEFIVPNTMFLTKEEAKRHLELNHYHYTSKAHTYAMTAWRAPKVERLINILLNFDFEEIK